MAILSPPNTSLLVMAATQFNGKVYILYSYFNIVTVYLATPTYERQPEFVLEKMNNPIDIMPCNDLWCLFITDLHNIWQATFDNNRGEAEPTCEIWLNIEDVKTLSVTRHKSILVTQSTTLSLYNYNAQLLQKIQLGKDLAKGVQHAIETSDGHILVCQADSDDVLAQRITIINKEGEVLNCYGGKLENDGKPQIGPRYASVNNNLGVCFVMDFFNSRILQFDDNLNLQGVLLKHNVNHNKRFCFVNDLHVMILSGFLGVVEIYRVLPRAAPIKTAI